MLRNETRSIMVGNVQIGGQNKVVVQSMCNTPTKDAQATIAQINRLQQAGCEIVRMSVMDMEDAKAISEIKTNTNIPLVADIHFDYRLALASIEAGIDKIRINRATSVKEKMWKLSCRHASNITFRFGSEFNSGSLEKDIHEKYGKPCAEGMMESAQRHVDILESMDFHDIVLSFKSSDPLLCIDAYRQAAERFPYPLHLGVTEAGTMMTSAVKSSMALGTLLNEGIGDTIRISVNGDPCNELIIVRQLLKCCRLIDHVPNLIACPTCGRTAWDMQPVVNEIEAFLATVNKDVTVAIMGCVVNGPGEAKHADIAIAGGKKEGLLFAGDKLSKNCRRKKLSSV